MYSMKYSKWKSQEMFASICRQLRQVSDLRWFPHRHACSCSWCCQVYLWSLISPWATQDERESKRKRKRERMVWLFQQQSFRGFKQDTLFNRNVREIHTRQIRARLVRKKVDKVSYTVQSPWWFWLRRREQRLMNMYYSAGTCTNA